MQQNINVKSCCIQSRNRHDVQFQAGKEQQENIHTSSKGHKDKFRNTVTVFLLLRLHHSSGDFRYLLKECFSFATLENCFNTLYGFPQEKIKSWQRFPQNVMKSDNMQTRKKR